jgi:hypothetical protein
VHVETGPGHAAALERREQRCVVDQLAARSVHDAHPRLDAGERLLADQVPRFGRERRVKRQVVRALQHLVEAPELDVGLLRHGGRHEGVERLDLHAERAAAQGHLPPDAPEADDTEALAEELHAGEGLAVPAARLHRGVGGREVPRQGEHQRHRQLGRGDGVAPRRVHDQDPAPRRRLQVDVVDTHPRAADHPEALRGVDHLGVHLAAAANEDGVVRRHPLHQLRGRQGLLHVHGPAFGPQDLGTTLGDALQDENADAQRWPFPC